jgi:hypothetical protein
MGVQEVFLVSERAIISALITVILVAVIAALNPCVHEPIATASGDAGVQARIGLDGVGVVTSLNARLHVTVTA